MIASAMKQIVTQNQYYMSRNLVLQLFCTLVFVAVLQACESRVSTEGDAFENEKTLREQEDDSFLGKASASGESGPKSKEHHTNLGSAAAESMAPKPSKPAMDPWQAFQNSLNRQIAANETLIWRLKVLPNNAKNLKRILSAEQENTDLKAQILQFQADEKVMRDQFMVQMNSSLDKIGQMLKESQGDGN